MSVYSGFGRGYQGVAGIVQESLSGLWLGILFLANGRNLTIPIVGNGVSNTLALVVNYLNQYSDLS